MQEPRAQRTLVKSPPELWAEVSDVDHLARHLGEFGEIRITRLEPETTVAWEGDRACGTVALEPAGWGTKVTLTAKIAEVPSRSRPSRSPPSRRPSRASRRARADRGGAGAASPARSRAPEPVAAEPEPEPEPPAPEPAASEAEAAEAPKVGFFARLFGRRRKVEPVVEVEPDPEPEPAAEAEPVAVEPEPLARPSPSPSRAAAEPGAGAARGSSPSRWRPSRSPRRSTPSAPRRSSRACSTTSGRRTTGRFRAASARGTARPDHRGKEVAARRGARGSAGVCALVHEARVFRNTSRRAREGVGS